jgi:hypothetical protein
VKTSVHTNSEVMILKFEAKNLGLFGALNFAPKKTAFSVFCSDSYYSFCQSLVFVGE